MVWGYDKIPHYRLNVDIINGYLRQKWGDFRFFIEVGFPKLSLPTQPRLTSDAACRR